MYKIITSKDNENSLRCKSKYIMNVWKSCKLFYTKFYSKQVWQTYRSRFFLFVHINVILVPKIQGFLKVLLWLWNITNKAFNIDICCFSQSLLLDVNLNLCISTHNTLICAPIVALNILKQYLFSAPHELAYPALHFW